MKKNIVHIVAVVVAIVIGGGAFYGGTLYANAKKPPQGQFQRSANGGNRFMAGAGFIAGQVIAKDNQSVTIKDRSGSSRIVLYSGTTEVSKFAAGAMSDIEVGKNITVNGKTNPDGSITAQTIQLRPDMPMNQQGNK